VQSNAKQGCKGAKKQDSGHHATRVTRVTRNNDKVDNACDAECGSFVRQAAFPSQTRQTPQRIPWQAAAVTIALRVGRGTKGVSHWKTFVVDANGGGGMGVVKGDAIGFNVCEYATSHGYDQPICGAPRWCLAVGKAYGRQKRW
jgi:hypothetical protein